MPTILVVDDEVYTRLLLSDALSGQGYKVISAATAQEALRIVQQNIPHLVLLDIKLPGMNGIELLQKIREIDAHLPVIIITAFSGMEKDYDVVTAGISAYLVKPLDLEILYQKIKEALG